MADPRLQDKRKSAVDPAAALAIAKEAGFVICAEAFAKALGEISEEELEGIAGGIILDRKKLLTGQFKCPN